MNRIIFIALMTIGICRWVQGQEMSCTEILSLAEEAYRNGRFDEVRIVGPCLGVFRSRSGDRVGPPRMRKLVEELEANSLVFRSELGEFYDFGQQLRDGAKFRRPVLNVKNEMKNEGRSDEEIKTRIKELRQNNQLNTQIFSRQERRRAYILLGQTFGELDVQPLSQFFVERLIKEHPIHLLSQDESNLTFNRLYNNKLERVVEFSIGPMLGLYFNLPFNVEDNRGQGGIYPFSFNNGNIGIGFQLNIHLRENLSIGTGFMELSNSLFYEERPLNDATKLDFELIDRLGWFKIPIWIKWAPSRKIRPNVLFDPKFFFQGGISINHLTKSRVSITIPSEDVSISKFNQNEGRNRWNSDLLLGAGVRFKFARGYFSFSFNLAYGLDKITDQETIGSRASPLFDTHRIVENNYQILTGFWYFTYAHRFNLFKKDKKDVN